MGDPRIIAISMNSSLLKRFTNRLATLRTRIMITEDGRIHTILLFILIFALVVRLLGIAEGLPYIHHFDEPYIASTALQMMRSGDLNPHWFYYPGFMMYACFGIDILHYLHLVGQSADSVNYIKDIVINKDTGWNWTISHPSFYLWNRGLIAIFGTIAVYFTFLIGKEVSNNSYVGLIGACFVAASSELIKHSQVITPNMTGVLFVLGAVYFSLKFNSTRKNSDLLNSLIFVGLAIATKYNYAICMIIPMLSFLANAKHTKFNYVYGLVICFTIPTLVFFLFNPFTLINFSEFLGHMSRMIRHYKVMGHGSHTIEPGITHFLFQIGIFKKEFGIVLLTISVFGMILSFKLKNGWLLFLFPAIYMLYMTRQRVDFHRNFIALYPFIGIWIGLAVYFCHEYLKKWVDNLKTRISGQNLRTFLIKTPYTAIILVLVLTAKTELVKAVNVYKQKETRSQAIDTINELVKNYRPGTTIAIAKELRIHEQDLRRLNVRYDIINHLDFKKSEKYKFFVTALYSLPANFKSKEDSIYNVAYANNEVIRKIAGRSKMRLKVFTGDPTIYIYERGETIYSNISPSSFDGISKTSKWDENAPPETYIGTSGGEYTTPIFQLEPGIYRLSAVLKGTAVANESAKLEFTLGDRHLAGINTTTSFSEFSHDFEVDTLTKARLRLYFLNDHWNPEKGEDRNFYIKDLRVQKVR